MIWILARRFLLACLFWIVPPPMKMIAKIDSNKRCPVCGETDGALRTVLKQTAESKTLSVFCQHTCNRCGARFYEVPVMKVGPERVYPAVPRTEMEVREDALTRMEMIQTSASAKAN